MGSNYIQTWCIFFQSHDYYDYPSCTFDYLRECSVDYSNGKKKLLHEKVNLNILLLLLLKTDKKEKNSNTWGSQLHHN